MRARPYWVPWLIFGFLLGAGFRDPGIAFFVAIAALASLSVLALLRAPGSWMGVAGFGIGFSAPYVWALIDPTAPGFALAPLVVGLIVATTGVMMFRRRRSPASGESQRGASMAP